MRAHVHVHAQVDFTLAGHVHLYERSCPVYKKTCMPANVDGSAGGTVHAVVGNAGQWLSYLVQPDTPHYMDVIAIEHGYMRYTANATALHAQVRCMETCLHSCCSCCCLSGFTAVQVTTVAMPAASV